MSAPAPALRPRSADTRARVLRAAIAAICERGLSDTAVAPVARRVARSPRNPSVDAYRRELEARWIAGYAGIVERIAMVEHELLALA
jgi:hypothetical protein